MNENSVRDSIPDSIESPKENQRIYANKISEYHHQIDTMSSILKKSPRWERVEETYNWGTSYEAKKKRQAKLR